MAFETTVHAAVRRSGRAVLALALAVTLGLGVDARPATADDAPLKKLDFAGSVTWLGQIPILVAIDKGFFKEQGLDVGVQVILNSSDRVRAITAGSVAFSNLGRTAVISEMARGNKSFYYFANVDDSPGNEGCWARAGFASLGDLKGKKIAANASAEITLVGLLKEASMTTKDIELVNLPPNEMVVALANSDVDAACVWRPVLDKLKTAAPDGKMLGTDKDTESFRTFGTMSSPDIMIISKTLVDEDPESARKIAVAVMKGADFATKEPEETARTVAHYFKQPPDAVLAGIKDFKYFGAVGWPDHIKRHTEQMKRLAAYLAEAGKIPATPAVEEWMNVSFIPAP
ncbi:NitT/TauT family transport system substrate-binding protein [Methylopila capsulata]|uniref:NitT/TauT family transport system substrate-binding protein n=1 Tax=Methylopila capsulata TaxID=61654 RepID=A0A9W6IU73_9HYPH|nr:ABC transporter substrate-binding protein [Methylopila capsulata]MBM7852419.1 NitT/TauT family transport system substrate-binding protein [Methylopila capsulata]GLK56628.1 taurine ABC transporter substrate-binding protein [Methylopila capsulata]